MPTDVALLAEVPLFQSLDDQERADLAAQLDVVSVPAGQPLFSYGDPGDSLYVLRSGEVEVFFKNDTGERVVLERAKAGYFLGELGLLDGGARTASAVVVKDLEALRLDRGDLDMFLQRHPAAALDMLTVMGRRLRVNTEMLRHTASRNVNEEVEDKRTLVERAADWIAWFSGSMPFLSLNALLFLLWILLNANLIPRLSAFDPFPFGLLTMAVSLEAIFLSIFVLISQNRQAAKDRVRSDIEYDVNLKAELEVAHLHEKLDHVHAEVLARLANIERTLAKE